MKIVKDRLVQYPNRVKLTQVGGDVYDVTPTPGTVYEEGTPINKELFDSIDSDIKSLTNDFGSVIDILPIDKGGTGLNTYAAGDLIYAGATNTLSKLAIGSNGKVLKVVGGILQWSNDNDTVYTHPIHNKTNTSNSVSPEYGGTFTVIDSITVNEGGHVVGINTKTITLPSAQIIPTASSTVRGGVKLVLSGSTLDIRTD